MRKNLSNIECIVENEGQSNAVVLFHGFGADCSDLVPLADFIDPEGKWTWIFPNGPLRVDIGGGMTGRAWFPIPLSELQEAQMGGLRDYSQLQPPALDQMANQLFLFAEDLKKEYSGLVLGGFSQGGMIATHLLGTVGAHLRGAILMSTVLLNQPRLEEQLKNVEPKPFFQCHGARDPVLRHQFGMALYQFLKKQNWPGQWLDFSGGHEIPPQALNKAREFLAKLSDER